MFPAGPQDLHGAYRAGSSADPTCFCGTVPLSSVCLRVRSSCARADFQTVCYVCVCVCPYNMVPKCMPLHCAVAGVSFCCLTALALWPGLHVTSCSTRAGEGFQKLLCLWLQVICLSLLHSAVCTGLSREGLETTGDMHACLSFC